MNGTPTFSLLHPTARLPRDWQDAARAWLENCDHPEQVEYLLVFDAGYENEVAKWRPGFGSLLDVVNHGRHCPVDAYNTAAALCKGQVLIGMADDWFPCPHWDTELLAAIPDLNGEYVVRVNFAGDHSIMTHFILTRKRYERYGYLLYPGYLSMKADNDFSAVARRDGVIVDVWDRLLFEHKHPTYGTAPMDEVYAHEDGPEAWEIGNRIFNERVARGFQG